MTADQILAKATPLSDLPVMCGVYFLIGGGNILYVGQSVDVCTRIATHARTKTDFDQWFYIPCERAALNEVESHYIDVFAPPQNRDTQSRIKRGECGKRTGRFYGTHIYTKTGVFSSVEEAAAAHGISPQLAYQRAREGLKLWSFFTPGTPPQAAPHALAACEAPPDGFSP